MIFFKERIKGTNFPKLDLLMYTNPEFSFVEVEADSRPLDSESNCFKFI